MTQSANTLDISRPGSFRMNAGICCALGPLLLIAAILFSDTSFTGFERTLVLATCAFVAVLCIAGIISGWKTLKASKEIAWAASMLSHLLGLCRIHLAPKSC